MGRRGDIVAAVETRLNLIATPDYNFDILLIRRQMIHWKTLDKENLVPALLILAGDDWRRVDQPQGEYTYVDQTEETFPVVVRAVVKEVVGVTEDLTDLVLMMVEDLDKALSIDGDVTLGVSGVRDQRKPRIRTFEGYGTPLEVIDYRMEFIHTFPKGTSV